MKNPSFRGRVRPIFAVNSNTYCTVDHQPVDPMKNLAFIFFALLLASSLQAQKIDSASIAKLPPAKQEEVKLYLRQANNARTTGLILCFSGGSIAILGMTLALTDQINNGYNTDHLEFSTGQQVMVVGAMVALASIPFFIKVHNKRDAARAIIYTNNGVMLSPSVRIPGTASVGMGLMIGF